MQGVRDLVQGRLKAARLIKAQTGLGSVREVRGWWRANREAWLDWVMDQGGMSKEGYGR